MISLPIDAHIERIVALVRERRAVVVTAAPGAGKTTRVPPALIEDGPVLLLQPRRVAARAIARRIADERGWTIGREVGWHVRFDRQFSSATQLIVATEGILTARLQQDPLLSDIRTVIIDEFHERSIHADLGLALAKQAWIARPDLRLVVMSATIESKRVAAYLDDCPIVDVPGRQYPIEISYRPNVPVEQVISESVGRAPGALLCFLPGAGEIRRAADRITTKLGTTRVPILPLHGGLDADAQDAAIRPSREPRIILATNLAETTLTVPDVVCVVDSGLHKSARYDPERAIDSLETERISLDSADQRAGRAGRTQGGIAIRLWDERDRLRPHREAEISRVDLASTLLAVLAWGGDARTMDWFEAPPARALEAAFELLRRLDGLDAQGRITETGRTLQRLPVHPRLGRILLSARGAPEAARACALLSERHFVPPRTQTTTCDLLAAVDRESALPPHVPRVAREIREAMRSIVGGPLAHGIDEVEFRRAVLSGYPDRVARRRAPRSDWLVLASGTGAKLARESGVLDAEFMVAVDVTAGNTSLGAEALVRMATGIDREWLVVSSTEMRHSIDAAGDVRATRVEMYEQLVLSEHAVAPEPDAAAALLAEEYLRRDPPEADRQLLERIRFARASLTLEDVVRAAAMGVRRLADVRLAAHLPADVRRLIDREAPETIKLPSGRVARLEYRGEDRVVLSTRLQDVFGLAETPRVGGRRVPITCELLAPSGRPVQVTTDLASFWARGYAEVRKELRGRYPKHKWPETPGLG